jgi:hypothetical protein
MDLRSDQNKGGRVKGWLGFIPSFSKKKQFTPFVTNYKSLGEKFISNYKSLYNINEILNVIFHIIKLYSDEKMCVVFDISRTLEKVE